MKTDILTALFAGSILIPLSWAQKPPSSFSDKYAEDQGNVVHHFWGTNTYDCLASVDLISGQV